MDEWRMVGDGAPDSVDVLVIGGGPAGSTAALVLARRGWRVAIADRAPLRTSRIVETLPPESRSTLKGLGLWARVIAAGAVPACGTVSWWDSGHPIEHDFIVNPSGSGRHIDRHGLDRLIRSAAIEAGTVLMPIERLVGATGECAASSPTRWRVQLAARGHAREISARFLVNAPGRSSGFRPPGDVRRLPVDRLVGLATIVEPVSIDVDRRPWIEATPTGWWYSAPGTDGRWSAVFFTDADLIAGCGRRDLAARWSHAVTEGPRTAERFRELGFPRPAAIGGLHVVAADSYTTSRCQGDGWVAAGDAASAVDPLSGQGIERALRSGIRAALTADAVLQAEPGAAAVTRAAAIGAYQMEQTAIDRGYLRQRHEHYARVRRWSDRPFWQRRNAGNRWLERRRGQHV
jgi:2-polyprenyl-6-methoxyphenol hydroxylase-like FAD-dependent oxidoreductase